MDNAGRSRPGEQAPGTSGFSSFSSGTPSWKQHLPSLNSPSHADIAGPSPMRNVTPTGPTKYSSGGIVRPSQTESLNLQKVNTDPKWKDLPTESRQSVGFIAEARSTVFDHEVHRSNEKLDDGWSRGRDEPHLDLNVKESLILEAEKVKSGISTDEGKNLHTLHDMHQTVGTLFDLLNLSDDPSRPRWELNLRDRTGGPLGLVENLESSFRDRENIG